jgi:hypothetical protein
VLKSRLHACHIQNHITHGIVTDQKLGISKEDSTWSSCPHSIVAISWQWHPRLLARGPACNLCIGLKGRNNVVVDKILASGEHNQYKVESRSNYEEAISN